MQSVVIDPLVAFTILDDYMRRASDRLDEPEAVEGEEFPTTGKKDKKKLSNFNGGVLLGAQIKNTFYVRSVCPSIDTETYTAVQKLTATEKFLGWYTTDLAATNVAEVNADLKANNPLIISLSLPTKAQPTLGVRFRAFMTCALTLKEKGGLMKALQELDCTVESADTQTNVVVDTMVSQLYPTVASASDPSRMPASTPASDVFSELSNIKTNLLAAKKYVDEVISGKREGDKTVGRALAEVLVTNKVSTASTKVVEEKLQDVMMLQYLATITAQQVAGISATTPLVAPRKVKASATAVGAIDVPGSAE